MTIHSGPFLPAEPGMCGWRHHHSGAWLSCDDTAIPGVDLCADCFIREAHARADSERTQP